MDDSLKGIDEPFLVSPKQRRQATTRRVHAKIEDLREQLRNLAREIGPGNQLPTTRELCNLLNTSSATLIAALDLLETEQIVYRKERQGIFVSENIQQRTIHVVFNISSLADLSRSPFWALLWAQILLQIEHRSALKSDQYRFHFLCRPHGLSIPDDYITILNASPTNACIIIGANARTPDHTRLLRIPHVSFAGGSDIVVLTDLRTKVSDGIYGLAQRGCKRIGCWFPLWTSLDTTINDRSSEAHMARECFEKYGLNFYPELLRQASVPPSADPKNLPRQDQGYLLAKEIFGSPNQFKPDGIYISDDLLTAGALVALEELGVRVGTDVQIATLTNAGSPILYGQIKRMIAIEFDPADIARALFLLLDEAMLYGYKPEDREIWIQPRLRM